MAKLSKDAALVHWIEAGSGELRSQMMQPHNLQGGTYESEIRIKYAVDPIEIATIYLSRAGNDWEKAEVERLRTKAHALQADRRAKREEQ